MVGTLSLKVVKNNQAKHWIKLIHVDDVIDEMNVHAADPDVQAIDVQFTWIKIDKSSAEAAEVVA